MSLRLHLLRRMVYARGPPGGGGHWVLTETRRRLERLLIGEMVPHPSKPGRGQMMLWDQDTFKDVLETAAFTSPEPSYRHAKLHAQVPAAVSLSARCCRCPTIQSHTAHFRAAE